MDAEDWPGFNRVHRFGLGNLGHSAVDMSQKQRFVKSTIFQFILRLKHGRGQGTVDVRIQQGHVRSGHAVRILTDVPSQEQWDLTQIMIGILLSPIFP